MMMNFCEKCVIFHHKCKQMSSISSIDIIQRRKWALNKCSENMMNFYNLPHIYSRTDQIWAAQTKPCNFGDFILKTYLWIPFNSWKYISSLFTKEDILTDFRLSWSLSRELMWDEFKWYFWWDWYHHHNIPKILDADTCVFSFIMSYACHSNPNDLAPLPELTLTNV